MPDVPLNLYPLNTPIGRTKEGKEVFIEHRYHRLFFEIIRRLGGTSNSVLTEISLLTPGEGSLMAGDGDSWVALTIGTDGQVLIADSTQDSGMRWADLDTESSPEDAHWEPVTNGDVASPEILFSEGDVVMVWVT